MSVQFGRWDWEGRWPPPEYIEKINAALAPYGPDSKASYSKAGVRILYRAFHTTKESRREQQPHISPSGVVITWDGRLDNRMELVGELRDGVTASSTDIAIVSAAYEQWSTHSFAKLIGDWAVSIWNPMDRSLILAKDPIGTRNLYYLIDKDHITWSTVLAPLILFASRSFEISEEYMAGWLSRFPAAHLTPWVGVRSVPPSSFVLLRTDKHVVSKYWDFDGRSKICYRTDAEYEEHFRAVFGAAVHRNLRSDGPILAELSGGRDSSSIVCVADTIFAQGAAVAPRLDTISYYDDSEPNWNERPYFTKVEEKRGLKGCHVDLGSLLSQPQPAAQRDSALLNNSSLIAPGADGRTFAALGACMTAQRNRVMLSGIGGDEVMGGVPTPVPELQDLLATAQFGKLAHQLKLWAIQMKKPWLYLFFEAARDFLPPTLVGVPIAMRPVPWLQAGFVKRHWAALTGYNSRTKVLDALPTFQNNLGVIEALQRQLAGSALPFEPPFEKRYPYLDRSLLEFIFALPREQLVRPTQRRSLMRRALVGIVPDEILNRKTKAFISRSPLVAVSTNWAHLVDTTENMLSSLLGIVDSERLYAGLQKARRGEETLVVALHRTICLEGWLRDLRAAGILNLGPTRKAELTFQASRQARVPTHISACQADMGPRV